jgi:hypothetical protein
MSAEEPAVAVTAATEVTITWSITETTTYRITRTAEDLDLPPGLPADPEAVRAVLMCAPIPGHKELDLWWDADALAEWEESENEIEYDNSSGREVESVEVTTVT